MAGVCKSSLSFNIIAECNTSRARTSLMRLPNCTVNTPVFMPVGTKGTVKGMLPDQLEAVDCQIILGNTYHLGIIPGSEILKKIGGLHKFMGWNRALLTDSGGFQMVSLSKLACVTEKGVQFESLYGEDSCMLTPEKCMNIQNAIGADVAMQLDDVLPTLSDNLPRLREATERTSRWLDRCLLAHKRPEDQNIFAIVQGSLNIDLRKRSLELHMQRDVNGYAIGGLSGGEAKSKFWRIVHYCTGILPRDKPRYVMGVGHSVDIVICCALGCDMYDCVYPTRTARFGCALVPTGQINLKHSKFEEDFSPIYDKCSCSTCQRYNRAYINSVAGIEPIGCHLISIHNLHYMMELMKNIRESIKEQKFPEFVKNFMDEVYYNKPYPKWVLEALSAVDISLK